MSTSNNVPLNAGSEFDTGYAASTTVCVKVEYSGDIKPRDWNVDVADPEGFTGDKRFDTASHSLWLRSMTSPTTPVAGSSSVEGFPTGCRGSVIVEVYPDDNHPEIFSITIPPQAFESRSSVELCNFSVSDGGTLLVHAPVPDLRNDDPLPASPGQQVASLAVVIDTTASMRLTSHGRLPLMVGFAGDVASGIVDRTGLKVYRSDGTQLPVHTPAALGSYQVDTLASDDAGFTSIATSLKAQGPVPVLVLSDGFPAPLAEHPGPVHVLSTRQLPNPDAVSHSLFDAHSPLVTALAEAGTSKPPSAVIKQEVTRIRDYLAKGGRK